MVSTIRASQTEKPEQKTSHKHRAFISSGAIALVAFIVLNIVLNPVARAWPDSNGMTETVRAFRDGVGPNVVIAGSSMANHVYRYLSADEKRIRGISNLSFNLQIPSDGLILCRKVLVPPTQPKLVVFCVGPRDFEDNDLRDPTRTSTFRRLVPLTDLPLMTQILHLNFFDSFRATLDSIFCLHDQRSAFQTRAVFQVLHLYDRLIGVSPTTPVEDFWSASLREYAWRYEGICMSGVALQMGILNQEIELLQKHRVKVVLVNLPMSRENLSLLPAGFYSKYRQVLADLSRNNRCLFLDCAEHSSGFTRSDFEDCAHLSPSGASKVFGLLAPILDEQLGSEAHSLSSKKQH